MAFFMTIKTCVNLHKFQKQAQHSVSKIAVAFISFALDAQNQKRFSTTASASSTVSVWDDAFGKLGSSSVIGCAPPEYVGYKM